MVNKKIFWNVLGGICIATTIGIVVYLNVNPKKKNEIYLVDLNQDVNNAIVAKSLGLDLSKTTNQTPNKLLPNFNDKQFRIGDYNYKIINIKGWEIKDGYVLVKEFVYSDFLKHKRKVLTNFKINNFKKSIINSLFYIIMLNYMY